MGSPLLSSLLTKSDDGISLKNSDDVTTQRYLKEMGLQGHVPILVDNGEGKLVTLSEDLLKSVMETDSQLLQGEPAPKKKSLNPLPFDKDLATNRLDEDMVLTDSKGVEPDEVQKPFYSSYLLGFCTYLETCKVCLKEICNKSKSKGLSLSSFVCTFTTKSNITSIYFDSCHDVLLITT